MEQLRFHLISAILKKYRKICNKFSFTGFIYFDHKVGNLDRLGKGFLYNQDEILPIDWRKIKSSDLLKVYLSLKDKKFYFNKEVDGRFYKTRLKVNVK